jgi:Spy/CpxP family protein refolding chaperone
MQKLILLTIAAGMAWAQQPASNQENIDDALRKLDSLAKNQQLAALQAQIAAAQAQLAAYQAKLEDLRTRYTDSYPEVRAVRARLEELRVQQSTLESQLARMKYLVWNGAYPAPAQPPADSPKIALPERWWKNSVTAQYLGLTADQQKRMDDVLQQFRSKLVVENDELRKQEVVMEPMVSAAPLDEAKITAQIDRVAEARAELEKTNGRMLLGIRKLLTPDQWVKLNQAFTLNLTQK